MADKQLARSGTAEFDVLADDDPLAELARIVGYDNRPAVQQLQELEKHREMVRHEPLFDEPVLEVPIPDEAALDLEGELLREFDVYDAPVAGPALHVAEPVHVEPQTSAAPLPAERDFTVDDAVEPEWGQYEEEEFSHQAPVEAAVSVEEIRPAVADEPDFAEPVFEITALDEAAAESWVHEPETTPLENVADWTVEHHDELAFDGADLERELELSIGYDDTPANETVSTQTARLEPEMDFGVDPSVAEAFQQETVALPAVEEQVAFEPVPSESEDLSVVNAAPEATPQLDLPEWQPEPAPVSGEVVISPMDPHGIDALLADIERFPVPPKAAVKIASSAEATRKNNYPFTPTFSRATPVASNGGVLSQKAFATPLPAAVVAAPVPIAVTETLYQPADMPAEPVVVEATSALKPPVDEEPQFDLDTFELDLSDIDLEIDPSEFDAAVQESAFAAANTVVLEPAKASAAAPVIDIAEFYEPANEEMANEEPANEEPESVLPFDPSMISESEESLTAMTDLHVPQLPVVEHERPVAQQPDYDLDIDAEMAQLFGTPNRGAGSHSRGGQDDGSFGALSQSAASTQPSGGAARVEDDFDEFEKAMEEDFRLSLSQRQDTDPSSDRLAVGSGYSANDDYDEPRSPAKRRLVLLAAAVAGLAIFGGVGVYAFMGGAGSVLSGGDPKIILADKSPVKMVPVEKGGKTVPNQDKAVYDRVAGAQDTMPQQGTLVSSTEEPMDVVQRTLTPENLPLEGRADSDLAGATPVDDDGSDRLLPDDQTQSADNANEADSVPAISPRKVRTMIVKPDGTLVAREEPVAQPETNVASNQTSAVQGDPQVKMVKTSVVKPATNATQEALATAAVPEQKSALAEAADATVDETAPVRSVKTTAVADNNPVPQTRPAAETAKVVDTFASDIKKTQPEAEAKPAEAKPIETASIAPGTYVMQIASLPSEAEAQTSYKTLSGKFGGVIGGKGVDIKRAEIAGKGTYFRVRIPAGSRDAANALCAQYKSAGGSCLVTR